MTIPFPSLDPRSPETSDRPSFHDHDGAGAVLADPVAGAAQEEPGDPRMPVLAQDDQVHPLALGVTDDRVGGVPSQHDRAQATPRLRAYFTAASPI